MKIVQLDIQGFRSLKNVSWRPGDLNVVIGPNGSGKSNLLRMMELISATAERKLDQYLNVSGGIGSVLWDGQAKSVRFNIRTAPLELVYALSIDSVSFGHYYHVASESITGIKSNFKYIEKQASNASAERDTGVVIIKPEAVPFGESLLADLADPLSWDANAIILDEFQKNLVSFSIYQDIRTDQNAPIRQSPVSRLEQRVAADGQNLINVLHTLYTSDRKFKQDINDGMFAAFGADFDELIFPPAADQRIQMRVRWKTLKREQSTADLSDGTLRFLFLLTVLASPNPPPLVAIDEPETGLHPSMLPIIAEFAVEAATRTQVIFTTHSDQFLRRFKTRGQL